MPEVCVARRAPVMWPASIPLRELRAKREREGIPTHVGNRGRLRAGSWVPQDHPHTRGEQPFDAADIQQTMGSSPRTWGTDPFRAVRVRGARIIPTHVGNSSSGSTSPRPSRDHPHARGEPHVVDDVAAVAGGSSPRTWGTDVAGLHRLRGERIIPTHVGNSCLCHNPPRFVSDHPHARGEQRPKVYHACSSQDHPHARGEQDTGERQLYTRKGSSCTNRDLQDLTLDDNLLHRGYL